MADEQAVIDAETVEVLESEEVAEEVEAEAEASDGAGEDEGELVVSIGDESPTSEDEPEQPAPEWVKELRKQYRELKRENHELKAKASAPATENKPVALGKKPTLEDHDYDADKFEAELSSWYERKREYDAAQAKAKDAEEQQKREWQAKLDAESAAKSKLRVSDYDEAEMVVLDTLSQVQQGIITHGSDNSALLKYAIGKNPKKAKELAAINDPVKFAFAVAKLEKELKVSNRKAPPPEKTVAGSGAISGAVTGSNLARLKDKAQQTGDWDAYFAAKRKTKSK